MKRANTLPPSPAPLSYQEPSPWPMIRNVAGLIITGVVLLAALVFLLTLRANRQPAPSASIAPAAESRPIVAPLPPPWLYTCDRQTHTNDFDIPDGASAVRFAGSKTWLACWPVAPRETAAKEAR